MNDLDEIKGEIISIKNNIEAICYMIRFIIWVGIIAGIVILCSN